MKLEVFFSLDTCFIRFTLLLIILCVSSVQSELYSLFSCWYQRSEPIRDRITRNLPRNFTEYPDCEQSAEGCRYNLCVNNIAVLVILAVFTLLLQGKETWSTTHLDESIRTCYLVKGEEWKTDIWQTIPVFVYNVRIVHNVHNVYSVYMICLIFGIQMMFWNIIWLLLGLYDINMVENRLVCVKSRDFIFIVV